LNNLLNYTDNGQKTGGWYPPEWWKYKVSELVNPGPTGVYTFIDSHPDSGDGIEFVIKIDEASHSGDEWAARPGEQHNQGANAAFADGQVDHWRWRWSRNGFKGTTPVNDADQADFNLIKAHLPRP